MADKITLDKAAYRKMQRQVEKLEALERGGVDNWEWYGESLKEWSRENEVDELAENFLDSINDLSCEAEVDFPSVREAGPSVMLPQDDVRELFLSFLKKYDEIKAETS